MRWTAEVVLRLQQLRREPVSLDAPATLTEDAEPLADLVPDDHPGQLADFLAGEAAAVVELALQHMTPREARVLRCRYGIGEQERLTLEETGALLGVTRERARQVEQDAMEKARRFLSAFLARRTPQRKATAERSAAASVARAARAARRMPAAEIAAQTPVERQAVDPWTVRARDVIRHRTALGMDPRGAIRTTSLPRELRAAIKAELGRTG